MPSLKLLISAENVIRDVDSNNVSAVSILDTLHAAGFPVFVQKFDILATFEREPSEPSTMEFDFVIECGHNRLVDQKVLVDFQDKVRNNTIVHVNGLVIPAPCPLHVSVASEGEVLQRYIVNVEQIDGPQLTMPLNTTVAPPTAPDTQS